MLSSLSEVDPIHRLMCFVLESKPALERRLSYFWRLSLSAPYACLYLCRTMKSAIRIVLINTSHPGNIGAVARAMKNMCLSSLYLVQPQLFPSAEATARASGADDILAQAVLCDSLAQAVQGCALVVGASARSRSLAWPVLEARESARQISREAQRSPVAIVFGREHSGLSNAELQQCHQQLVIPGNPDYMSLNIAAAVQIVAYEIWQARREPEAGVAACDEPITTDDTVPQALATADDMERYYQHLEQVLVQTRFLNPQQPKQLMRRLRRLYQRARPDNNELNILRGILTAVQQQLDQSG